jgi:hypothetical protein
MGRAWVVCGHRATLHSRESSMTGSVSADERVFESYV